MPTISAICLSLSAIDTDVIIQHTRNSLATRIQD